jgi:hypothetical protein
MPKHVGVKKELYLMTIDGFVGLVLTLTKCKAQKKSS